jgi:oligopeptide transport system substrate-binding protein
VLTLSILPACHPPVTVSDNRVPMPGVFRMNLGTEPPELDPAKMDDLVSYEAVQPLMKGLTAFDKAMAVQPAIAESWTVSPDGCRYIFHLRPKARWSDGKPVLASDFVYAWKRALTPATGAPYTFFLYTLKNGRRYYEQTIKDFDAVGVHALNARTLQVDLEQPTPFFLALTAAPVMMPLRQDSIEQYDEQFTEPGHFLSNGAYRLSRWAHEEKMVLRPNPYFYDIDTPNRHPRVARLEFLMINDANTSVVMYENRELDFIETSSSIPAFDVRRLRQQKDAHTRLIHRINYFGFNVTKPPFNNPKVRQAFAYALDRSVYPKLLQSGQRPLASWISPGLVGYNPKLGLEYDPAKARRLLAEAGYPDGKGFPPVSLSYQTVYDIRKEAEIAQALWKKVLNVEVRLDNMEWKMLLSRLNEDPPALFRMGWFADYPDADSFMSVFLSESGNNHSRWKSPAYDTLVRQAGMTLDSPKRQALYDQAQRLLLEHEAVIIPIFASEKLYLARPYVKGLEINALNLANFDALQVGPPVDLH